MTEEEIAIRQKLKDNFVHYAVKCLSIRSKLGVIKPFELNVAQQYIHKQLEMQKGQTGKVRALILKGRQMGCSTYVGGRFYHRTTFNRGTQCFILTHALDATNNLYKMAQRFYENTPKPVQPQVSTNNSKELIFGRLDSGYKIGTAENKSVGRSSTIQLFHGCLEENTLIYDMTTGGVRCIKDFTVTDVVLTHTGKTAGLKLITSQEKECFSLLLRSLPSFPLLATKEHRFWAINGRGYADWIELKHLKIGDAIGFPVRKITDELNHFNMPDPKVRSHGGGRQFIALKFLFADYNFGRFLGLYLADGHIKLQSKFPFGESSIQFALHRKESDQVYNWVSMFKHCFSSISIKHRTDCLTTVITLYGSQFAQLVNNICGRVKEKHFPKDWHRYGEDFAKGLMHGYLAGDGHFEPQERRISASSILSSLTMSCRDIMASLDYGWPSISYREGAVRNDRNEKSQYTLRICGKGAIKIAKEMDRKFPKFVNKKTKSIKNNSAKPTDIWGGYAWLRITEIEVAGLKKVYDFTVGHDDHSYCTIHGATHNSECAFWANASEHAKGILQAVPDAPGTEIILESTANGVGNYFHQMWQKAEAGMSDFIAIFVPWFWQPEYQREVCHGFTPSEYEISLKDNYGLTNEQLNWRRFKVVDLSVNGQDGEKSFCQEYPCNANEAFQLTGENTFIESSLIMHCRKDIEAERFGPLLLACDPARFGDDRTSIIMRQGRVAFGLQSYTKKDTMEVVGILVQLIKEHNPTKLFVDVGGLGAGVVDRLMELGYKEIVVAVNAGSKPLDGKRYSNKRAEMWGLCKSWLLEEPCKIPDVDSLHADICGIKYSFDSNSRLVMERKEDMKRRGVRSSDEADALCLTFALPVSAFEVKKTQATFQKSFSDELNARIGYLGY